MPFEPLISFILPAYKAPYLHQSIQSILGQNYRNLELIVIDDCSPADLKSIVEEFQDPRLSYFRNEVNIGGTNLVQQWNHCITFAKGDYLVLAADDDVYEPDFLSKSLLLAEKYPEIDLIRARVAIIDEENKLIGIDGMVEEKLSKHGFLYFWLQGTIFTCIGNYIFKTATIKDKKFIDFPSAFCADAATTINLAQNGVATTEEMLFNFRISSIHLSSSKMHLKEKLKANTLFYTWLLNLGYEDPINELDWYYFHSNNEAYIKAKCSYDYYNQVIKFLPWHQITMIRSCDLLSTKGKITMAIRFIANKLLEKA